MVQRAYEAAANFYITDVIEPCDTRATVSLALRKTLGKRGTAPEQEARQHADVNRREPTTMFSVAAIKAIQITESSSSFRCWLF